MSTAYLAALHLLARRALTVEECRRRLADRGHGSEQIDAAIAHLLDTGGLDDGKVARAHARTSAERKGRGRLRVLRELHARGVPKEVAAEAVGEVFGDKDERTLVNRAIQKKLRGQARPADAGEYARLYQFLMRQGFTPAVVSSALRRLRSSDKSLEDEEVQ